MKAEDFLRFAESYGLQHVLSSFFAGVSRARKLFDENGKDALDKFMDEIDEAKELYLEYYVERSLWPQLDIDEVGYLDNAAIKFMLDKILNTDITAEKAALFTASSLAMLRKTSNPTCTDSFSTKRMCNYYRRPG